MPQDNRLDPETGAPLGITTLAPFIVIPKRFDPMNPHKEPPVPFSEYPKMPLIPNPEPRPGKNAPIPIYLDDTGLRCLTFRNAREEAEYIKSNPEMAAKIAEVEAAKPLLDPNLAETNKALRAVNDRNKELKAERDSLEDKLADSDAKLATAMAELAAAKRAFEAKSAGVVVPATAGVDQPAPKVPGTDAPRRPGRPPRSAADVKAALKAGGQS